MLDSFYCITSSYFLLLRVHVNIAQMREYLAMCNDGNTSREVNHGVTLESTIIHVQK